MIRTELNSHRKFQLSILVDPETGVRLIALAYLEGHKGRYGPVVQKIIYEALDAHIAQLPPDKKEQLNKILETVRITHLPPTVQ